MMLVRCDKNMIKVLSDQDQYEIGVRLFAMNDMFYHGNLSYCESLLSMQFDTIDQIIAHEGFVDPRDFKDVTNKALKEGDFIPVTINNFTVKATNIKDIDGEGMYFNFVAIIAKSIETGRYLPLTIIELVDGPEIFTKGSTKNIDAMVINIENWNNRIFSSDKNSPSSISQ